MFNIMNDIVFRLPVFIGDVRVFTLFLNAANVCIAVGSQHDKAKTAAMFVNKSLTTCKQLAKTNGYTTGEKHHVQKAASNN